MNKFDELARRQAGEVPGFVGADESLDDYAARTAAEADADHVPTSTPFDPTSVPPYWPQV